MLALRIIMVVIAVGALGLSTFLLMRQQDGITLNTMATALMWGGYGLALVLLLLAGFVGRKRA